MNDEISERKSFDFIDNKNESVAYRYTNRNTTDSNAYTKIERVKPYPENNII